MSSFHQFKIILKFKINELLFLTDSISKINNIRINSMFFKILLYKFILIQFQNFIKEKMLHAFYKDLKITKKKH
jgi:hypothetical protein